MGFNTTIFILNDALHEFKAEPKEFAEGIYDAVLRSGSTGEPITVPISSYCNYIKVMPTAHADIPRLYYTHGNSIMDIGTWPQHRKDAQGKNREHLKKCLKEAKRMIRDMEAELKKEEAIGKDNCIP